MGKYKAIKDGNLWVIEKRCSFAWWSWTEIVHARYATGISSCWLPHWFQSKKEAKAHIGTLK